MGWREDLQPASFRGVPFEVEDESCGFGRRNETHEYPKRDRPYVEDLGRKARDPDVTGFVIGDDYMAKRDKLLAAIEAEGPGELVHPWYGRMTVSITDCRVSHSIKQQGMCTFQISFIESGELSFPVAASAPGAKSLLAVDVLQAAAIEEFSDKFSIDNMPAFAVDDAIGFAGGILDNMSDKLGSLGTVLDDPLGALKDQLGDVLKTPSDFAGKFFDIFAKGSAILTAVSGLRDINALNFLKAFGTLRQVNDYKSSSSNTSTPTRAAISANQAALNTLARQSLLVQVSGMTAAMPLPVYDDATKLRSELLIALDDEAAVANDTTYLALTDVRAKVFDDMNTRIQGSARLMDIKSINVQPALVIAYDLYESIDRESEILARNKVQHPGFVPAETLKVLSV